MSVNKDRPHLLVLPEDKANRQLANGFWLELDPTRQRQMQVLSVAGGWNEVLNLFGSVHIAEMDRCPTRFMVLLIDFDGHEERLERARDRIPQHLTERVFVLGALIEPEALKPHLGSYEEIGSRLAADCRDDSYDTWGHALLQHNAIELARLREHVRRILFPTV
ncbi:MAG TPA: hypothetical protein VKV30_15275 [Candidatus Angelobacter sp.]|nr:hypothetical protein [Candidatus Angelobacter sp.]